ncbi:MAG: hypothetical protein HUU46_23985 [Candidatus Hydrogenedentes bacterium]|nr:hypothetical protein [Candidatus Hydrogenedentota bacterium]
MNTLRMSIRIGVALAVAACAARAEDEWVRASANGERNRVFLNACWRFVHGWLQHADPATGLIPRNLNKDSYWNAKDSAADNYPFMVLSCFYTDRALFEGRMKDMLAAEQKFANRVGALPDDYDFTTKAFRTPEPKLDDLIFGASEYAKDGLVPLTELLGPSPWSERMLQLLDDILNNAAYDTEVGKLPSTSHEVCGDLMQALSRMYWMTKNDAYRDAAFRLAAYFLEQHPPEQAEQLRLDDHGCEVIGGLSEVYFIAAQTDPARRETWKPAMHRMLDRVLDVARDENGLLYNLVNPVTGEIKSDERTDNWGYNYNAFLVVANLDGASRYWSAVEHVLKRLPASKDYPWEGARMDGFADSLEGGMNLINRIPVPEAIEWADYTADRMLATQRDTGVIEGWHGDGNFARTALMYALWKSRGCYVEPWRADVRVGAVRADDGTTYVSVESDWPWTGKLRFDVPRHSDHLHIPSDYPRLNQFPEWLTIRSGQSYIVNGSESAGDTLRAGLDAHANKEAPFHATIK